MPAWIQAVLAAAAVAVAVALVVALTALRRVALRAAAVLDILESELRPLVAEINGLIKDVRVVAHEARDELVRVRALTERAREVTDGLARIVGTMAGLTRAGQLMGLAASVKRGLDVFVQRLRKG